MSKETIEEVVQEDEEVLSVEDGETSEPQEQHAYSKEEILDYIRNNPDLITEEDTFAIPAVRSRVDRVISKKHDEIRQEWEKEQKEKEQRDNLARQARQYVSAIDGASAEQLRVWGLKDPQLMAKYQQAQDVLKDPDNQYADKVSQRIYQGVLEDLRRDMPDEDFAGASNVIELVNMAKEKKLAKDMIQLEQMLDSKLDVIRKELRGEKIRNTAQPEVNPVGGSGYAPDSFEAIEEAYVNGTVSTAVYEDAIKKRKR